MIEITYEQTEFDEGHHIFYIPSHMIDGLQEYINHHIRQGSFLHAVLCNDFMQACMCADHWNIGQLPAFANFLYHYAPRACYGSKEKVEAWINKGKTNG